MKIGRLIILVVMAILLIILFGDGGLVEFRESRETLQSLRMENRRLVAENELLREEILLLRNDLEYLEELARRELGMIREGETVYRFHER